MLLWFPCHSCNQFSWFSYNSPLYVRGSVFLLFYQMNGLFLMSPSKLFLRLFKKLAAWKAGKGVLLLLRMAMGVNKHLGVTVFRLPTSLINNLLLLRFLLDICYYTVNSPSTWSCYMGLTIVSKSSFCIRGTFSKHHSRECDISHNSSVNHCVSVLKSFKTSS